MYLSFLITLASGASTREIPTLCVHVVVTTILHVCWLQITCTQAFKYNVHYTYQQENEIRLADIIKYMCAREKVPGPLLVV